MGNRGRLADDGHNGWRTRSWICCTLTPSPGRDVSARSYTPLFFTDEATALAAGFRPCAQCRRADYRSFSGAWATATGVVSVKAPDMDAILARERRKPPRALHPTAFWGLPSGAFVEMADEPGSAWLVQNDHIRPWVDGQYGMPLTRRAVRCRLITPPSIVRTLRAGYEPRGLPDPR